MDFRGKIIKLDENEKMFLCDFESEKKNVRWTRIWKCQSEVEVWEFNVNSRGREDSDLRLHAKGLKTKNTKDDGYVQIDFFVHETPYVFTARDGIATIMEILGCNLREE